MGTAGRWRGSRVARVLAASFRPTVAALAAVGIACTAPERALVRVGGSSSLVALSEAVAEDFAALRPWARVTVTASGSGSGMRRLCEGLLDVAGASRPISTAESARCDELGVALVALPIARDGVTVVAHPDNALVSCLTLDELGRLWEPNSDVTTWRDLRPSLPPERIRLFGPGPGSGTYDFFTQVVVGRPGAARADHYQTDNDHLVARGVAGHPWALGYLGSASFTAHDRGLRAVAVDTGFGCMPPTRRSVSSGAYSPLARDLHLYVSSARLNRPAVRDFVGHYAMSAERLALETGHVPLPSSEYVRGLDRLARIR